MVETTFWLLFPGVESYTTLLISKIHSVTIFKFHSNLDYKLRNKVLLPKFYKKYSPIGWSTLKNLQSSPLVFWTKIGTYNKYVRINKKKMYILREFLNIVSVKHNFC